MRWSGKKLTRNLKTTRIYPGHPLDKHLPQYKSSPLRQPILLSDLLKRTEINYKIIASYNSQLKDLSREIIDQIEYEIKYEGFILRQKKEVERFKHIENIKIPQDINYDQVPSISVEIRQKLKKFSPANLGQAHRISGVTPAAISVLMVFLKKYWAEKQRNRDNACG